MRATAVLFILLTSILPAMAVSDSHERQLRELCQKHGGQVTSGWTCPNSGKVRQALYCEIKNLRGQSQFFNGCTKDFRDWGSLFFKACVVHDFCYHNEPGFSGKSKADCDQKFRYEMEDICDLNGRTYRCYLKAGTFFRAVQAAGKDSWNCAKNDFEYINRMSDL